VQASCAPAGAPDPCQLPVAAGQTPDNSAYNALNVPGQPAGFSYNDPVSGVRIWKVTSSSFPAANTGAGHDYADGPNQVSRGWGPNNNTHTILVLAFIPYARFYLVDFTRGAGFSPPRELPDEAQPPRDLCFSFSSVPGQERIAYVINGGQLKRFNTATMQIENTGNFPLNQALFGWLQQDKTDTWFVGLVVNSSTAFAWNSQTNQYLTHTETWLNEPRLERDGRYVALTDNNIVRLWDLSTNTFGPQQDMSPAQGLYHNADLRSQWVVTNANISAPFAQDRYAVSGGQLFRTQFLNQSAGAMHQSGNWIQSDADLGGDLNRQWSFISGYNYNNPPWQGSLLWNEAIGIQRSDGSDQRFIAHHHSVQVPSLSYWSLPFATPSPDGRVVIFNSNMNQGPSARYDLFVAEMPLSGSPPPPPPPSTQNVGWTNLTNVTANGNSVTKTSGGDGWADAGPISSQTIVSGDGYVQFQYSSSALYVAAGLSNGNTDNTRDDIDFALARAGGSGVEVRENGVYKSETPFDSTAVFRVEVVNGVVQYKMNGTVFYTSSKAPTYPLLLDTWIGTVGASINNAVISGLLN